MGTEKLKLISMPETTSTSARLTRCLVDRPKDIAAGKLIRLHLTVLYPCFTLLRCVAHLLVEVLAFYDPMTSGQNRSMDSNQTAD